MLGSYGITFRTARTQVLSIFPLCHPQVLAALPHGGQVAATAPGIPFLRSHSVGRKQSDVSLVSLFSEWGKPSQKPLSASSPRDPLHPIDQGCVACS